MSAVPNHGNRGYKPLLRLRLPVGAVSRLRFPVEAACSCDSPFPGIGYKIIECENIAMLKIEYIKRILLTAVILAICTTPLFAADSGYINRCFFTSGDHITGPAFSGDSIFIARDNDGIYKLSTDGRKEKFVEFQAKFLDIKVIKGKVFVLTIKDGKSTQEIFSSDLTKEDSPPAGDLLESTENREKSAPEKVLAKILPEGSVINKDLLIKMNNFIIADILDPESKGMSDLVILDSKSGKTQWKLTLGGRIINGVIDPSGEYLFIIRDLRARRYVLNRIEIKTGRLDRQVLLGEMTTPVLSFPPPYSTNIYKNSYLYLTGQKAREADQFASITVFNTELEGDHKFILSPFDYLQYTYARLKNAAEVDSRFREYLSEKYSDKPEPYDGEKIRNAVQVYREALEMNRTNPFLNMYYILARMELGATRETLKDEITEIDKKCNYDVFELSLIGSLFYRYRHYEIGDHFLEEAVKYIPAATPDYERSYASLFSSPGYNMVMILHQMKGDKDPDYGRMFELVNRLTDMLPSSEYNYYIWSVISGYYRDHGDKVKAVEAAKKAKFHFYHNRFFPAWKVALFDMLSSLAVILGIMFLLLSIWFGFRANRRKNHYLSETSGIKEMGGIIELYHNALSPGEKNLLGFLMSLGILSVLIDGILLLLRGITRETFSGYYGIMLAVSIITGVLVGLYMLVVLVRIERSHYGDITVTGNKSLKDILNNSFLPFLGSGEKLILISLSLAGVVLAFILLYLQSSYIFMGNMPANIVGGRYGSDQSFAFITKELGRDPGNPYTHLLMGYEYLLRGEYDQAEKYYQNFLASHPGDIGARANLALIRSAENPLEAISILEKLLQNRQLKKNYIYADRVYYDLILLERETIAKDAASPWQKSLDEMKSGTVEANALIHPGKLLLFPPSMKQEKRGLPTQYDYKRVFYSYLFPFVSVFQDGYRYSTVALIIAVVLYWLWTIVLVVSFHFVKEPPSVPYHCQRCGKLICEKCILPYDDRQWCTECDGNKGFQLPSIFRFLIPGISQIQMGNTIRGTIYLVSFLYGLFYCFILFFPLRENVLSMGSARFLGILQAVTVPDTIFPYNVAKDPALHWFTFMAILMPIIPLILNFIELMKSGKYKVRPPIPAFETQLLEVKEFKTRLIMETQLMNLSQIEATKKIKSADRAEMAKIAEKVAREQSGDSINLKIQRGMPYKPKTGDKGEK